MLWGGSTNFKALEIEKDQIKPIEFQKSWENKNRFSKIKNRGIERSQDIEKSCEIEKALKQKCHYIRKVLKKMPWN